MASTPNLSKPHFTKVSSRAGDSRGDISLALRVALAAGLSLVLWLAIVAVMWRFLG